MKLAVRFVIFKLCVPVNAASVELTTVGLPNGNQPSVAPSSKSYEIGAGADCVSENASM